MFLWQCEHVPGASWWIFPETSAALIMLVLFLLRQLFSNMHGRTAVRDGREDRPIQRCDLPCRKNITLLGASGRMAQVETGGKFNRHGRHRLAAARPFSRSRRRRSRATIHQSAAGLPLVAKYKVFTHLRGNRVQHSPRYSRFM